MSETSNPPNILIQSKTLVTRGDLHTSVRKSCLQNKVSLKYSSVDFRNIVEQSLQELLKVQSLSSEQLSVAEYFSKNVPKFYKKCHNNHTSVIRNHSGFFEKPLFVSVDASYENNAAENRYCLLVSFIFFLALFSFQLSLVSGTSE